MNNVVLASPFHDPQGTLSENILEFGPKLKEIFGKFIKINVTRETSQLSLDALNNLGFEHEVSKRILGEGYRNAIKLATNVENSFTFLVDFDRSLHWAKTYPDELKETVGKLRKASGFTFFKRTQRAFETHPVIQKSTETVVNLIASQVCRQNVDIMSGAFGLDNALSQKVVSEGKREDYGLYAEIFKIALDNKASIGEIEVEGLEWETPDQFKKEIQDVGYETWLKNWESNQEWKERIAIIKDCAEVLLEN